MLIASGTEIFWRVSLKFELQKFGNIAFPLSPVLTRVMCCTTFDTAAACAVVPYSYPNEEMRRGSKRLKKGDPPREVVERRKEVATARPRDRRAIESGDKPRSQQQQELVYGTNYLQEGI